MSPSYMQLATLTLLWALYGALHSALASHAAKGWVGRRWPKALPAYRLGFNAAALLLFLPPYLLMRAWGGPLLWDWQGAWAWLMGGIAFAALAMFVVTLRDYDLSAFSGTLQWRTRHRAAPALGEPDALRIGRLHRHVRHPWYFLALLLVWTQPMDAAFLVSALCWTAYLAIGLRLEERKLVAQHGQAYRRYQQRVPALVPRPWRRLSREEARTLEALAVTPAAVSRPG